MGRSSPRKYDVHIFICQLDVPRRANLVRTYSRVIFTSSEIDELKYYISRDFRIASLKLNQVFDVWGLGWNTTFILNGSLEWLVLTVDMIDELVEFVNLAFAAVLEPIIGIIQSGGNIDYPTY